MYKNKGLFLKVMPYMLCISIVGLLYLFSRSIFDMGNKNLFIFTMICLIISYIFKMLIKKDGDLKRFFKLIPDILSACTITTLGHLALEDASPSIFTLSSSIVNFFCFAAIALIIINAIKENLS